MAIPICGNVFVFQDHLVVHRQGRDHPPPEVIPIEGQGLSWMALESFVQPILAAAGWHLDAWHRPRNNPQVLLSAFVWRD